VRARLVAVMSSLVLVTGLAEAGPRPALMPWPASIDAGEGVLVVGPSFRISLDGKGGPRAERAARRLEARLARQTGLILPPPGPLSGEATLAVHCAGPGQGSLPHLGMDESYRLEVGPGGGRLDAPEPWGVLRGMETFLQLVTAGPDGFAAPAVVIEDSPRFPWRGLLLDSGRHFMPVETVERILDGMAAIKLNVLHWHLTEDQGFRVESRRYPRLHQMGSDGRYYTQAQIRDVIDYAADRGIRVMPEFDMPGHTTSWFVGYPELATLPGPYEIERGWGIKDPCMDPTKDEVYRFLDRFLGEMADLFPDAFLHIGGDEVNGKHWDASERVGAYKARNDLADNHALQASFNRRVAKIVTKHGKQMMGWDEILHPDLPTSTVIQSWRGQESLAEAVRKGYRAILSHGYYVDLMHEASRHYAVDPFDKGVDQLSEAERERVLGGEACMWSEQVTAETVDSRVFPRTAAIAERLWSPREVKNVADMYSRLAATSRWLDWLGLDHNAGYERMLERLAGAQAPRLRELVDVVEPLEDYQRAGTGEYTSFTPLNRLVDIARPESAAAREFAMRVAALLEDPARRAGREEIRASLTRWQGLSVGLRPLLESRAVLREAVPLAADASAVAAAGLEALGFLEQGVAAPESWASERSALVAKPKPAPHALEVAYRPAVALLVDAARQ